MSCRTAIILFFALFSINLSPALASCIAVRVEKHGDMCMAFVTNNCGSRQRCFVSVVGYTSSGQSYREQGTVLVEDGDDKWYGISRVVACGSANARCERFR
jgi:hypothetical protein